MARPDCPRCGSDLIVAAPSEAPSVLVMELRGENVPVAAGGGASVRWLCRSCGHRWDPADDAVAWLPEPGVGSDPGNLEIDAPRGTTSETAPSPGTALMRARHEAGKSLAEASKATGVWERYLQALESDAPLEEFPSHAYARLYLRGYAGYLHLDPEPLLRELDALHPAIEEPILEPLPDPRGRRRVLAVMLAIVSAAALTFLAIRQPSSPRRAAAARPTTEAPVAVDGAEDAPRSATPTREPKGVRVTLTLSQPSWVEAVSDGEVVAAETLEPGRSVAYRAKRSLQLTLGNAGGVHLRVNGERVVTGSPGEVVSLDFRWRDGAVSTERG